MTIILKTGDYTLSATITPVTRLPGQHHIAFTSQLATSKNPQEHRTVFQFTGGGESIRTLSDLLLNAIQEPTS